MQMSAEQRRDPREFIAVQVRYHGLPARVGDYTDNLSRHGMFVLTRRSWEVGTRMQVTLSFPGLLPDLTLQGVVRWRRLGTADERGVGFEFDEIDPASLRRLADFLDEMRRIPHE
jgi:uncharacterized protein (TIGR02266 family)